MRTFIVGFVAVLSCVAMIGATPVGSRSPVEAVEAPSIEYVALQQLMGVQVLTRLKSFLQSRSSLHLPRIPPVLQQFIDCGRLTPEE